MSRYFDMVDDPSHVRKLTLAQQIQLAEEIRSELITTLARTVISAPISASSS
jgi:hypothetical protein